MIFDLKINLLIEHEILIKSPYYNNDIFLRNLIHVLFHIFLPSTIYCILFYSKTVYINDWVYGSFKSFFGVTC